MTNKVVKRIMHLTRDVHIIREFFTCQQGIYLSILEGNEC
jgi:hypothetical protein